MDDVQLLRPIIGFEDNIRPSQLMLQLYRLLDSGDDVLTEGDLVDGLRKLLALTRQEDMMVVQNEIFLGLIRERAQLPRSSLKTATLCNLLRQSIVAACTALDAYLPALLRVNLPTVIRMKGREFFPQDKGVQDFFSDLSFSLQEVLRLTSDEDAPLYISNKLLGLAKFKYLSSKKGVHTVGALLGVEKPWASIAAQLNRDKKELVSGFDDMVRRRNDIVHRADRCQKNPDGEQQSITFARAKQGVDTINHICLALDELVSEEMQKVSEGLRDAGEEG